MGARLFIAFSISPSEKLLQEFGKIRQSILFEKMNWVNPEQMHVTLKFIGETPPMRIDAIKQAMMEAFAGVEKSEFKLESLGVFGSSYAPKVLWTHVRPEEKVCEWFEKLKQSMIKQGFEYDRQNFVPHLTWARIKFISDKNILQQIVKDYVGFCFSQSLVDEITLFQSILKPTGAEYIRLFSVHLD